MLKKDFELLLVWFDDNAMHSSVRWQLLGGREVPGLEGGAPECFVFLHERPRNSAEPGPMHALEMVRLDLV